MHPVKNQIRQEFIEKENLDVALSNVENLFEKDEDIRRRYLDFFAVRYPQLVEDKSQV